MVEAADFSHWNHPVGGFLSPAARADYERARLAGDKVAFLREHGYITGNSVVEAAQE